MAESVIKKTNFPINKFTTSISKRFKVEPVYQGDLFIFSRNGEGIFTINDQGSIVALVTQNNIHGTLSGATATFTRDSQYTGCFTAYTASSITFTEL